jgi:hypothetical protein
MQTLNVYSYYPVVEVQLVGDPNVRTRNRQLYSPTIKIYRNTDNLVRLLVKNQDQKPVNISTFTVLVDLCDASNNSIVERYDAVTVNAVKGICEISISASTLYNIESRFYYLTIRKRYSNGDTDIPAYIDDNYSVKLPVEVLDGYLPYDQGDVILDLGYVYDSDALPLNDLGTL